ncbi:MAG: adenylosuccinate lyase, partial [Patescibacteria group bacterium]|nr:adenylosuccinate lyase [Patescibacteria group bacterium]
MKSSNSNKNFDYQTYLSPFTWRYGSQEMREIWSDINKRKLWRKNWVELARAQNKIGLVTKKELNDIIAHQNDIDIEKAHKIEKEIYHDVMAEIKTFAAQCKIGGGKIHLGATST